MDLRWALVHGASGFGRSDARHCDGNLRQNSNPSPDRGREVTIADTKEEDSTKIARHSKGGKRKMRCETRFLSRKQIFHMIFCSMLATLVGIPIVKLLSPSLSVSEISFVLSISLIVIYLSEDLTANFDIRFAGVEAMREDAESPRSVVQALRDIHELSRWIKNEKTASDMFTLLRSAGILASSNHCRRALEAYDHVLSRYSDHQNFRPFIPLIWFNKAVVLSKAGRDQEAVDAYKNVSNAAYESFNLPIQALVVRSHVAKALLLSDREGLQAEACYSQAVETFIEATYVSDYDQAYGAQLVRALVQPSHVFCSSFRDELMNFPLINPPDCRRDMNSLFRQLLGAIRKLAKRVRASGDPVLARRFYSSMSMLFQNLPSSICDETMALLHYGVILVDSGLSQKALHAFNEVWLRTSKGNSELHAAAAQFYWMVKAGVLGRASLDSDTRIAGMIESSCFIERGEGTQTSGQMLPTSDSSASLRPPLTKKPKRCSWISRPVRYRTPVESAPGQTFQ
jgi:tetratricopeptide (TPR) repeat protein